MRNEEGTLSSPSGESQSIVVFLLASLGRHEEACEGMVAREKVRAGQTVDTS